MATVRLTDLLPTSGFLLPYALPLFFASLVLTFAGAFLTLDRTRSFAPVGDVFQDRQKSPSRFIGSLIRGGVGGILTGFVFGIHFTTFLSLLIPSVTTSQPLKPAHYVSVWLLSSLFTSIAAGRWKYFGFVASGFCGGTSIALAVSVTIHPSLLTRVALVSVFASTLAILTPLPITRLQPILLRTSASAVGSFGLILSIALFSHIEPWSNVWERLWVHDDIRWGSAQEKGLSAGFFLFLASGIGTDWWLKFKFGENPDQKWDSYLAQYVANLPAESDRAGIFYPFVSMWSKPPVPLKDPVLEANTPLAGPREKDDNFLRTGKRNDRMRNGHSSKTKMRVKFRPLNGNSTDSDTEEERASKRDTRRLHPWLPGADSAALTHPLATIVLDEAGLEGSDLPDYSDHEVDITSNVKPAKHGPDWSPRFLQNKAQLLLPQPHDHLTTLPLDQALSGTGRHSRSQKNPCVSPGEHDSSRWQAFWRDVNEKIQHKESL